MPPNETDFYDHLELLRRNILILLGFFVAAGIAVFLFADPVLSLIRRPADALRVPLYALRPQEKFLTYVRIAFSTAALASVPVGIALAAGFIAPALSKREKRIFLPASAAVLLLFAAGVLFAFMVIIPVALGFFVSFRVADGIQPLWSFREYVRTVYSLLFAFCLVFESPLVLLLLIKLGIVRVDTLKSVRRHAVLLILVLSALITPPDVMSQVLVAGPLYLLYELTILLARIFVPAPNASEKEEVDSWTEGSS